MSGLHVRGNQILNGSNQPVRLLGVNRGAANPCVQNWGIFSGPTDSATVQAMTTWDIQAVRIPLNEDCWLGINQGSISSQFFGANYQQAIETYVNELNQYNIAVILDLHWSAPGAIQAQNQQPMPDADHAPAFWSSVANAFKGDSSVVFDLYNEPYPDNNQDSTTAWQCWLNGCSQSFYVDANGGSIKYRWQAAGMQSLVNAVRSTGATNIVMADGIGWGGILDQWLTYKPSDPTGNLAAGIHVYPGSWCHDSGCWDTEIAPVASQLPVVVGEMGETDCSSSFIDQLMSYLDRHGVSYLAWHWWPTSAVPCSGYAPMTDYYNPVPSAYGQGLHDHLIALAGGIPPTPTATPTSAPAPPSGGFRFDWEDGTFQGWSHHVCGAGTLSNSTAHAFSGTHSLAYTDSRTTTGDWTCTYETSDLAGLAPGVTVSGEVYSPTTQNLSFSLFTCDSAWKFHWSSAFALAQGWNAISWTVPSQTGLTCLGGQLNNPNGIAVEVDLDAVTWGSTASTSVAGPVSATSVPATSTPTSTAPSIPIRSTATPVPPTATPIRPTATPVPTTAAPVLSTSGIASFSSTVTSPASLSPGSVGSLSASITFDSPATGVIVTYTVVNAAQTPIFIQTWSRLAWPANSTATYATRWKVPAGTRAGDYTFQITVTGSGGVTGSVLYGQDTQAGAIHIQVGSASALYEEFSRQPLSPTPE